MTQAANAVTDNTQQRRFELEEQGEIAFADYSLAGDTLVLPHVEAPNALRGTGAAGRLMDGVVAQARERNLKLRPLCSYAVAWLKRHPEHNDLLA